MARIRSWAVQVIAGELVVLSVVRFGGVHSAASITVLALAVVAIVVTFGRFRGRWVFQVIASFLGFFVRSRQFVAVDAPVDKVENVLPGIDVESMADRAGNATGLIYDGHSWVGVVRVDSEDLAGNSVDPRELVKIARGIFTHSEEKLAAIQVLTRTTPVIRSVILDEEKLSDGVNRIHWIAIRFDPRLAPMAVLARGGGESGAMAAAAIAVQRAANRLSEAGVVTVVLDSTQIRPQLLVALGAGIPDRERGGEIAPVSESWPAVVVNGLRHLCFHPVRRRGAERLGQPSVPEKAVLSCVSTLIERGPTGVPRISWTIRVAVPMTETVTGKAIAAEFRTRTGVRLASADGAHRPALRATLPVAQWG